MKKLCLILTVLYAFGANCSAQSSLNIAENLLTGDNSTFESSMGSWTCNDNNGACSRDDTNGKNGEYSANVAPVHATGVTLDKTSASVKQGKTTFS